jgi:hypothetical protein
MEKAPQARRMDAGDDARNGGVRCRRLRVGPHGSSFVHHAHGVCTYITYHHSNQRTTLALLIVAVAVFTACWRWHVGQHAPDVRCASTPRGVLSRCACTCLGTATQSCMAAAARGPVPRPAPRAAPAPAGPAPREAPSPRAHSDPAARPWACARRCPWPAAPRAPAARTRRRGRNPASPASP